MSRRTHKMLVPAVLGGANVAPLNDPNDLWLASPSAPGAWFRADTAAQSFTATTGVTAVTNGVAVALAIGGTRASPLSQLGSELVANGTFNTDWSSWITRRGTFTVAGGVGRITEDNVNSVAEGTQGFTTEVGKLYAGSVSVTALSAAGNGRVKYGTAQYGTTLFSGGNNTTPATVATYIAATTTSTFVTIQNDQTGLIGGSDWAEFDNVTSKEMLGSFAAKQSSSGQRPVWNSANSGYLHFDLVDDVLTVSFPLAFTADVIAMKPDGTIIELLSQSITTSYSLPNTYDWKHCVIAQMTATQRAALKAWMRKQPIT